MPGAGVVAVNSKVPALGAAKAGLPKGLTEAPGSEPEVNFGDPKYLLTKTDCSQPVPQPVVPLIFGCKPTTISLAQTTKKLAPMGTYDYTKVAQVTEKALVMQ